MLRNCTEIGILGFCESFNLKLTGFITWVSMHEYVRMSEILGYLCAG